MDWTNLIAFMALIVGGGGFLFYSQKKSGMEIANAAALAAEWEKLYREQKSEREENDTEVAALRDEVADLRSEVASIRPYICYDLSCQNRITRNQKKQENEKE
jgi:predicted  nucleic acid-binding Zn-ribbon protein